MSFVSRAFDSGMRRTRDVFGIGPPEDVHPPPVQNPNVAANAALQTADQMRARRGLLANIYAGNSNQAPVSGKTQLGT